MPAPCVPFSNMRDRSSLTGIGRRSEPRRSAAAWYLSVGDGSTRARDAGIAYELIAARAELQAIVASRRSGSNEPDVRTLRGWRRELVGEELLELLSGRVSLSVRDGGVRADARGEAI